MTSDPISLPLHVLANLTYMDDLCKVNAIRPPTTCSYFGAPLGADAHSEQMAPKRPYMFAAYTDSDL